MTLVKDEPQTGSTVQYGDIVLGTNQDPNYQTMPCSCTTTTQAQYDDSGRSVIAYIHTLNVTTVLYHSATASQDAQISYLRPKLLAPAQTLSIANLGVGLAGTVLDTDWGPKPLACEFTPMGGGLATMLQWTVRFRTVRCQPTGEDVIESLSYVSDWSYDEAGFATRTISGTITMPVRAGATVHYGESARSALTITTPSGFKRSRNNWQLAADFRTVQFSVTDEELRGTPYPAGCVRMTGGLSMDTEGPALVKGAASLNMEIEVAKDRGTNTALSVFLPIFLTTQANLRTAMADGGEPTTIYPTRIQMHRGLGDESRVYSFSVQWFMTGCLVNFLLYKDAWESVPETDYTEWTTSLPTTQWGSRGVNAYSDEISVAITTCSNKATHTIGGVTQTPVTYDEKKTSYQLACPDVSAASSWLDYDAKVTIARKHAVAHHKLSASFQDDTEATSPIPDNQTPSTTSEAAQTPMTTVVSQAENKEDILEYQGYPTTYVMLQFRGLRLKYTPDVPLIKTIGGKTAYPVTEKVEDVKQVAVLAGCPVYSVNAVRIYRVLGAVNAIKEHGHPQRCSNFGAFRDL